MSIDFYEDTGSPPTLAVNLALHHLKIPITTHHVDLFAEEHLKPEFIKLNPFHTVPTIDDNGFVLWESRAIMRYLVNQHAPGNDLYPTDPKRRALVDRMLDFDLGTLYTSASEWMFPPFLEKKPKDDEKEKAMSKNLKLFDHFLSTTRYAAGEHLTIADFSLLASVSTISATGHNMDQYSNVKSWWNLLEKELPYYEQLVSPHIEAFKGFVEGLFY
ncbi:glutathione S-transferase 1: isoform D-like protein [Dinothrombium tinctorium]|uniref:Glutathione S-transferase 1: isoform D-like protein n=1 Tax=Dinothrombium tinctorium TaxID=1965070 RepID=A0A3S3PEF9_9ACAR|nr:glutathione S-transferase 1: isoform D-like protein [Dinothrombium tinctorium]